MVGQPTLWLTHTGPLADQAIERAQGFLPDIGDVGLIGRGKWVQGDVLTVAMVQTLVRNPDKLLRMRDDYGLVLLDEAHHCPARTFLDVVSQLNPYYLYGLTATPYRRDKLEMLMFQYLGMDTTTITVEEVEKYGGIIVPTVRVRKVPGPVVDGNNIQQILKKHVVNNGHRNSMIVSDVLAEARTGKFCIVISDRRAHCETLYKAIRKAWKKTGIVTGKYTKKQIAEQVEKFNNEDITVLVATFSLLGEGFDVPFLDRAFISMPFRAEAKAEQLLGRIQRSHPGKEDAVVYDYVDENIGVIKNQFFNQRRSCRYRTYMRLGANIETD
jgi:superfamily II DNA or RNA helicase